jgi:carboxymethylenebutenolidase
MVVGLGLCTSATVPAVAQESHRLTPEDVVPGVWGAMYLPDDDGPSTGIVVLHGSSGIGPNYSGFGATLAQHGFVALVLDYYRETGNARIGSEEKLELWPVWQETLVNAVQHLERHPRVTPGRLGLVGFSRGAFLAVSVAGQLPQVKAVVDFYGGGGGGPASLENDVSGLPPLLILHGEDDGVVPVSFAHRLNDAAQAAGAEVELHTYSGVGHAFNLPSYPSRYDAEVAADAFDRTVLFLRSRLEREIR